MVPCARLGYGRVGGAAPGWPVSGQATVRPPPRAGTEGGERQGTVGHDARRTMRRRRGDRNPGGEVFGLSFPTIALLAGADKDFLARLGVAKGGKVKISNVAEAVVRGREQAEAGSVPPLLPTGTAGGLGKEHNVLDYRSREPELDAQPAIHVKEV